MNNKYLVSYALWGESKLYLRGMLESIPIVHEVYPDFDIRVYCAQNCPALPYLRTMELADSALSIVEMNPSDYVIGSTTNVSEHHNVTHTNMIWRYLAFFDEKYDIVLTRDSDSRVCRRESGAVYDWIHRGTDILALYDHPAHQSGLIMPGLCGARSSSIRKIYGGQSFYESRAAQFLDWYSTQGYQQGLRFVHYDIHFYNYMFVRHFPHTLDRCGYGTNMPLMVPMPTDGSAGEHLGATCKELWRHKKFHE